MIKSHLDATSNSLRCPSCRGLNEPGRIIFLLKFLSIESARKKEIDLRERENQDGCTLVLRDTTCLLYFGMDVV